LDKRLQFRTLTRKVRLAGYQTLLVFYSKGVAGFHHAIEWHCPLQRPDFNDKHASLPA
jgi:hypothetical protein